MSEKNEPVWEEPPAKRSRTRRGLFWVEQAEIARTRPGQWLRVPDEHNSAQVSNITSGRIHAFQDGVWEAVARRIPGTDRAHIYLRYMGDRDGRSD